MKFRSKNLSLGFLCLFSCLFVTSFSHADESIFPIEKFPAGNRVVSLDSADLDGDGIVDIVAANSSAETVTILFGRGDGRFNAPVALQAGGSTSSVLIVDLNQDGWPDIAAANSNTDDVSIFLALGNGDFAMQQSYQTGDRPVVVKADDFNGDGLLDLITPNQTSDDFCILLGNGDGSFAAPICVAANNFPTDVATGDLNGDSITDVAVTNGSSDDVLIFVGTGNANFSLAQSIVLENSPQAITVGDWNGDLIPDLATANVPFLGSSDVSVMIGVGDGTFNTPQSLEDVGITPTMIENTDLNEDGNLDLIIANRRVNFYAGNGDGTFEPAVLIQTGGDTSAISIEDFNGDGVLDLASGTDLINSEPDDHVEILLGDPDQIFVTGQLFGFSCGGGTNLVAQADFNNDGFADFVATRFVSPDISIINGFGDGNFDTGNCIPITSPASAISTSDLNADNSTDLVIANDNRISIYFNNNGQGFDPVVDIDIGVQTSDLVIDDLNGDGILDILMANNIFGDPPTGVGVSILAGNEMGGFDDLQTYKLPFPVFELAVGDFNGDTEMDILARGSSLVILFGQGDGNFQDAQLLPAPLSARGISAHDFNNDGFTDFIVGSLLTNTVSLYFGNADNGFSDPIEYAVGASPEVSAVIDVNHDGRVDIVTSNSGSLDFSVLLGAGNGFFSNERRYAIGNDARSIHTGDYNGDGRTDLAFGRVWVHLNQMTNDPSTMLGDVNLDCEVDLLDVGPFVQVIVSGIFQLEADINEDGRVDLLDVAPFVDLLTGA